MHKIRNAVALANLLRIGVEPTNTLRVLRKWSRYQQSLNPENILAAKVDIRYEWSSDNVPAGTSVLYMTTHFGSYYIVFKALADRAKNRTVYCLIGEQSESHAQRLTHLASIYGVNLIFISGGLGLIRGLKRAVATGAPIVVLIDVPWGAASPPDIEFNFLSGRIKGRTALFRLAEKMNLPWRFVVAEIGDQGSIIVDHGASSQMDCMRLFEKHVDWQPQYYDRLSDLHRYFATKVDTDAFIAFRFNSAFYVHDVDKVKTFSIPYEQYSAITLAKRRREDLGGYDEIGLAKRCKIFEGRQVRYLL